MDTVFNYFLIGTQLHYVIDLNSYSNNQQVDFFWNNNHYYIIKNPFLNPIYSQFLSERLQYNLLYAHQKVLTQIQSQLGPNSQMEYSPLNTFVRQWQDTESQSFVVVVLDQFLQKAIFSKEQAEQLKNKFNQRKDFKKLCSFLLSYIDKRLIWQFIYLYYLTLKMLNDEKYEQTYLLQKNKFLSLITNDQDEQNNQRIFRKKFMHLRFLNEFMINIKKIIITMMRAIKGSFINPYYKQMSNKSSFKQISYFNPSKKRQRKIKKKKYISRQIKVKIRPSPL